MGWPKGVSGNPKGARPGVKRHPRPGDMLIFRARQSGDAYGFLVDVMDAESMPMGFRIAAAQGVLPYQRAKVVETYNSRPFELPTARTEEQTSFRTLWLTAACRSKPVRS
jgi:hypothetical protein